MSFWEDHYICLSFSSLIVPFQTKGSNQYIKVIANYESITFHKTLWNRFFFIQGQIQLLNVIAFGIFDQVLQENRWDVDGINSLLVNIGRSTGSQNTLLQTPWKVDQNLRKMPRVLVVLCCTEVENQNKKTKTKPRPKSKYKNEIINKG